MARQYQDLSAQANGTNHNFVLASAFFAAGSMDVVVNGLLLARNTDFTENSNLTTAHLVAAPSGGAKVLVYFDDPGTKSIPSRINVGILKSDYLFGMDLTDQNGAVMATATLERKLALSIKKFELEFGDLQIGPTVIKSNAVKGIMSGDVVILPSEPDLLAEADVIEPPYDYDVRDYLNYGYMQLRRRPVISIERIRLIYPTGQTIIQYPAEWLKLYPKFGQLQIVPMAGSFKQYPLIGQGAMYLPLMSGFLTTNVPSLIHVDYTAGFAEGEAPETLIDAIYKQAAVESLKQAGLGKMPGVQSFSTAADGLSESTTLTQSGNAQMFQAMIKQYEQDIKDFINDFREEQKGINFVVA